MKNYECMILVEPTAAAKEWNKVTEEIEKTYEKHGAKLLALNKWGERKLAYRLNNLARGTYVLTYFEGPKEAPAGIKADFVLSERVVRTLILQHEGEIKEVSAPPEEMPRRHHRGPRH
ncbi:MAG: 30S ribosomal protein S6 [Planctomycetota bacterium]|jgi:small subunit ribosomal protein S6